MTFIPLRQQVLIDEGNSTEAPLLAGGSFIGTAKDISRFLQIIVNIYGLPSQAKASVFTEFSRDGTLWTLSVPLLIRNPEIAIPIPLVNVHKYFRVRYLNDGGVSAISALGLNEQPGPPTHQTNFILTTYLSPLATKELTRTLDQTINPGDPVILTRNIIMEKQIDGSYRDKVNASNFYHSLINETTQLKNGPGILKKVVVNDSTSGTIKLYNSLTASGIIIAIIQTTNNGCFHLDYDIYFSIGLTIVTSGTPGDITFIWE